MHQGIEVILLLSDDNPTPGDTGSPDLIVDSGSHFVLTSDQVTDKSTYLTYSTNIPVVDHGTHYTITLEA